MSAYKPVQGSRRLLLHASCRRMRRPAHASRLPTPRLRLLPHTATDIAPPAPPSPALGSEYRSSRNLAVRVRNDRAAVGEGFRRRRRRAAALAPLHLTLQLPKGF